MEQLTKWKVGAAVAGALLALASTAATFLLQRVVVTTSALSISQSANTTLIKERDEAKLALTESERSRKTLAQSYEKRIAALNAKGEAILDANGNPVFNVELGSLATSEQIDMLKTRYEVSLMERDTKYELLSREMTELKSKVTKPSLRPLALALAYDFDGLRNYGAGRWSPGLGYNFILGPWVWTASALVGIPRADEALNYKLLLQLQP